MPKLSARQTKMHLQIAQLLTVTLVLLQMQANYSDALIPDAEDTVYIRHGRSKVRHSNEKEHLLWGLRTAVHNNNNSNNTTQDYAAAAENGTGSSSSSTTIGFTRRANSSGNSHLRASEFWPNGDANGTIVNQVENVQTTPKTKAPLGPPLTARTTERVYINAKFMPTATPYTLAATLAPVTHRIRKLHKKKIMESIRNSVDKSSGLLSAGGGGGLVTHLSKNHRSLAQAEHMQGRPTDLKEDDSADGGDDDDDDVGQVDDDLGEVMQLADELDLMDEGAAAYQNDEFATTQATASVTMRTYIAGPSDEMQYATFAPANEEIDEMMAPIEAVGETTTPENSNNAAIEWANPSNKTHMYLGEDKQPFVDLETENDLALREESTESDYIVDKSGNSLTDEEDIDDESDDDDDNDHEDSLVIDDSIQDLSEDYDGNRTVEIPIRSESIESIASLGLEEIESVAVSEPSTSETTIAVYWPESHSLGPSQAASTSVGGIGLDRQQSLDLEEINFDDVGLGNTNSEDDSTMDDGVIDDRNANEFPLTAADSGNGAADGNGVSTSDDEDVYETNRFLAGVVDAANEDEIYDWDEISRSNRRNLMRGRDVVTKFLQIVETQHSLGANCEAGTSLNLGEGVVDRYAQDRFRVEAEVAVNRANMLTRIFKMTVHAVQADVNLLHASVLSMVEFDDDIFAAGNCFDWNEHPAHPGLFCPFAYRLPPPNLGAIFAKDLATEYHYLGNTSEWFFQARKNAEKVIAHNEQYLKAFHLYSNRTEERIEDETLAVKYEDGRWSKPYYDCGGGNIWMLTYTVPFFGYENGTYHFKGTSGIDIDLRRVDIDQCPQRNTPGTTQPLNIFAGTDKCKQRTTMCEALTGLGFRRGSYKCVCRKGYYFPDTTSTQKFFNGSLLEEEYEKLMLGKNSTYNIINEYECLPCAEGCDSCEDGSPCIAALNWPMRTSILVLACTVIGLLPPAAWFTFRYQQVKVVRAASPALLRVIALGAFFIYCTKWQARLWYRLRFMSELQENIVMYPNPNLYTCTARIWLREIGFSLTYGALMLKTWRISVIFRVRSAKAVKITDAALLKRLGIICGVIGTCLLVRTLVSPPDVVVGRTADDLKAFLCKTDYWDYTFTSMEVLFLAWGVRLCIMVRKAPSEFNESRFISMAIYNEFLLTCFLNVSMLFLQSPANPDLLYIIFFCHTQLTVTLLLGLIFGSKVYIVLRSGKSHQESIGLGAKSSGAKFNFRPQVRTFANPSSITTSTVPVAGTTSAENKLSDQEALEEIRQLSVQLQRIQEMAPPKGVAVMTISSLLDGLKTPGGMMMVAAAAATQAASAGNQLMVRQQPQQGALPLLAITTEMHKYNQQQSLQVPQNNNVSGGKPRVIPTTPAVLVALPPPIYDTKPVVSCEEKAVNTEKELWPVGHIICSQCLEASKEHYYTCRPKTPPPSLPTACEQLGSPQQEGSISFANIKLECMCSQPDDLDQPPAQAASQRRHVHLRTAATNTPPPSATCRRRSKTKSKSTAAPPTVPVASSKFEQGSSTSLQDASDSVSVSYRICDNCKNKYTSSKSSKSSSRKMGSSSKGIISSLALAHEKAKLPTTTKTMVSQARSSDLLDRSRPHSTAVTTLTATTSNKKVHSSDDIIFYTATTSTSTDESSSSSDSESDSSEHCSGHAKNALSMDLPASLSSSIAAQLTGTSEGVDVGGNEVVAITVANDDGGEAAPSQSLGNVSTNSQNSSEADNSQLNNGNGVTTRTNAGNRSKRPDKLMLDLNDRSKYTKEVSV